jgi:hypothetical protein
VSLTRSPPGLQVDALVDSNSFDLRPDFLPDLLYEDEGAIVVEFGAPAAAEGEPGLLRERGPGAVRVGPAAGPRNEVEVDVRDDLGGTQAWKRSEKRGFISEGGGREVGEMKDETR